jgi:O-antigen/teichoic acid export membrane protein
VVGGLLATILEVLVTHIALPGIRNRLQWDWDVFRELFHFGKFIFLASGVTFLINQSDKLILGAYFSFTELGIYNIGYTLAALPLMLSYAINGKIVFPLYRHKPVAESDANRAKIFRARRLVIACSLGIAALLAYSGIWLVDFMYDDRYQLAGPMVVLMSLCLVPRLVTASYGSVLLAAGDSRNFFFLNASTAVLQTVLMLVGVNWLGIFGVLIAPALAILMTNPLRIYFVRKHKGWDALSDSGFLALGFSVNGFACWLHWDEILKLMA